MMALSSKHTSLWLLAILWASACSQFGATFKCFTSSWQKSAGRSFAKLLSRTESRANARPATRGTKEETDWKTGRKPETISPASPATLRSKLAYLKSVIGFQMSAHLQFVQEDSGFAGISKSLNSNPKYGPLLAKIKDDMTSIEQASTVIEHYMEYFEQESEKVMTEDGPEKMDKSFPLSDDAVRDSLLK